MGDRRILFDHIAIAVERMADAPAVLVGAQPPFSDGGAPSDGPLRAPALPAQALPPRG
jgi:hypothetical protein